MNRKLLLIVVALASTGAAHAQSAESQLSFTGSVVQSACNPAQPLPGSHAGMGSCGTGRTRSIYAEQSTLAPYATGIAMLDYFTERSGGTKYMVTREYR